MRIDWQNISLKELAGYLSAELRKEGIDLILVGGACVTIYSKAGNKPIVFGLTAFGILVLFSKPRVYLMPKPLSEDKQLKWRALFEKHRQNGLPIGKWCLQNEVNPHTFQYWKARLFPKQLQRDNFIELNPKSPRPISLRVRGLYIRLERDCDPHLRKQLLAFIGEVSF